MSAVVCLCHEVAGPLSALFCYLRDAKAEKPDALDRAIECATQLRKITDAARSVEHMVQADGIVDVAAALESMTTHLPPDVSLDVQCPAGAITATHGTSVAIDAAVRAVLRVADRPAQLRATCTCEAGRVRVRIDAGGPPDVWRQVDPWVRGASLDLWLVGVFVRAAGGVARITKRADAIELDVPVVGVVP